MLGAPLAIQTDLPLAGGSHRTPPTSRVRGARTRRLKLRRALESPAWPAALAQLPGHAPARSAEVLSLTQALPLWHYRVPRHAVEVQDLA